MAWGHGNIELGKLDDGGAEYVAGYTIKKMTAADDVRLVGRHPEFARMSLRPGIGMGALDKLAETIIKFNLDKRQADVPVSLAHGRKQLPLGRFLRRKLREKLGRDPKTPQEALNVLQAQLLDVRLAARADKENPSYRFHLVEKHRGAVDQMKARAKIWKRKREL